MCPRVKSKSDKLTRKDSSSAEERATEQPATKKLKPKRQERAKLPALGEITITLHKEAADLLDFVGKGELRRLGRVHHLGVVASAFVGAQHSRLEYVWQQCAMVELLRRFHKGNHELGISSPVKLSSGREFSSGEELLKCWIILSNYGRPNYTLATESALHQVARTSRDVRKRLLSARLPADIRSWAEEKLRQRNPEGFQYAIAAFRLLSRTRRTSDRVRAYLDMIRDLALPIEELNFPDPSQRMKIARLRRVFQRLRLVCIVAIDSYYSHQPIRLQLINALSLFDTIAEGREQSRLETALRTVAGLLADEVYLQPAALAAHRDYQRLAYSKLRERFEKRRPLSKGAFASLLEAVVLDGVGSPRPGHLSHVFRLEFPSSATPVRQLLYRDAELERQICGGPRVAASISRNPYSGRLYVDAFSIEASRPDSYLYRQIGRTIWNTAVWLHESACRQAESRTEKQLRGALKHIPDLEQQYQHLYWQIEMKTVQRAYSSLFSAALRLMVPDSRKITFQPHVSSSETEAPTQLRVALESGLRYDSLGDGLRAVLQQPTIDAGRKAELELLKRALSRSRAPIVIASLDRICIRDAEHNELVEWDAAIVELWETRLRISILESKKGASRLSDKAFKQLDKTIRELSLPEPFRFRRHRRQGGAKLEIVLEFAPASPAKA